MSSLTPIVNLPAIRHRRPGNVQRERTSLSIKADVLDAARQIVSAGEAENLSAFVELAIEEKIRRTKRAALYESYAAAASDPQFMDDMRSVSLSFEDAVGDGL